MSRLLPGGFDGDEHQIYVAISIAKRPHEDDLRINVSNLYTKSPPQSRHLHSPVVLSVSCRPTKLVLFNKQSHWSLSCQCTKYSLSFPSQQFTSTEPHRHVFLLSHPNPRLVDRGLKLYQNALTAPQSSSSDHARSERRFPATLNTTCRTAQFAP
jgi:hypothetical protein